MVRQDKCGVEGSSCFLYLRPSQVRSERRRLKRPAPYPAAFSSEQPHLPSSRIRRPFYCSRLLFCFSRALMTKRQCLPNSMPASPPPKCPAASRTARSSATWSSGSPSGGIAAGCLEPEESWAFAPIEGATASTQGRSLAGATGLKHKFRAQRYDVFWITLRRLPHVDTAFAFNLRQCFSDREDMLNDRRQRDVVPR